MKPLNPRERALIVLLALCLVVLYQQVNSVQPLRQAAANCQTKLVIQTKRADSLEVELFPLEIQLSRYEMAFTIMARRHPECADIYSTIISEETE
jgi:hypothetical protein